MLCLSRCIGESICITCPDGTELKVTLVSFRENHKGRINSCRLGFDAPKDYLILREEF